MKALIIERRTDTDQVQFAPNTAGTDYHHVDTCRIGTCKRDEVVNTRLRVHGLHDLRVVGSSIMPKIVGGNTMAPSIMIGEQAAEMIRQNWPMPWASNPVVYYPEPRA